MIPRSDITSRNQRKNSPRQLLLFCGLAGSILFNIQVFLNMKHQMLAGYGDSAAFYTAALLVRQRQGEKLYTPQTVWEIQQKLFPQVEIRKGPIFDLHLAYRILLWVPLTYFSYPVALIIWTALSVCILLVLSFILPKQFPDLRRTFPLPFLLLILTFHPIFNSLIHGQPSIILLLLYSLAYISLRQGKPFLAGCILAFALFKFQIALPLMAILLLSRQGRIVSGFAVTSIVPLSLSLMITGWQGMGAYLNLLFRANQGVAELAQQRRYAISPNDMPNLRGLFHTLFSEILPERYVIVLTAVCSIALILWAVYVWRKLEPHGRASDLCFAFSLVAAILVSYHMPLHDMTLLLLPMLIAADHLFSDCEWENKRVGQISIAPILFLMISPAYFIISYVVGGRALLAVVIFVLAITIANQIRLKKFEEQVQPALT